MITHQFNDNTSFAAGQGFTVTAFSLTDANA